MMEGLCHLIHSLKPAMLMVLVQIAFAAVNVFYKLAVQDGMNLRVVVAYRFIFATAFILPLAFFVERKRRPKMTWTILFQGFLCGLFGGSLAQNFYLESLALTSATFASAMANLIPAITFILAVSFRLERLNWGSLAGKAKVAGTLLGIGGAMFLTFYKGIKIDIKSINDNLVKHHHHQNNTNMTSSHAVSRHRLVGALSALGSCTSYALWLIIQTKMCQRYPCHYSSTALMSLMGALVSTIFAVGVERDWNQWKLGWNIRLLTVAYSGIVASGLMVAVMAWCVRMRGPLFVSIFNPLMLVLVAFAGALMLDEKLYLGSVVGAVLIVCGLYTVLWGKGQEMKKMNQLMPSHASSDDQPVEVVIMSPKQEKTNHNSTVNNINPADQKPTTYGLSDHEGNNTLNGHDDTQNKEIKDEEEHNN